GQAGAPRLDVARANPAGADNDLAELFQTPPGGLRALDGVVEELSQVAAVDTGAQTVGKRRDPLTPGVSPFRHLGVEQRHHRPVQVAHSASGLVPDAVGDDVPELLPVADDLREHRLEVVDRSTDNERDRKSTRLNS